MDMSSTSTENFSSGLLCPHCGAALGNNLASCSCGWELRPGARAKAAEQPKTTAAKPKAAEANKPIPLAHAPGMPDLDDDSLDSIPLAPVEDISASHELTPVERMIDDPKDDSGLSDELPEEASVAIYAPQPPNALDPIPLEPDERDGHPGDSNAFHERSAVVSLAATPAEPLPLADDETPADDGSAEGSDSTANGMKVVEEKVCCKCGKNVAGHRRFHDEHGYWCYECNKADKAQKHAGKPQGVRCRGGCGRIVPEQALVEYEGKRMCQLCATELRREAKERKRFAPIDTSNYKNEDKRSVFMLLGVFGILLTIIVLRLFHVIGY